MTLARCTGQLCIGILRRKWSLAVKCIKAACIDCSHRQIEIDTAIFHANDAMCQ